MRPVSGLKIHSENTDYKLFFNQLSSENQKPGKNYSRENDIIVLVGELLTTGI